MRDTESLSMMIPATCTTSQNCTVCNAELAKALGHTEETIPSVAPTCTEEGLTEGKRCSVCQEVTVAQNTVPAREHSYNSAGTCRYCESNVLDTLKRYVMLYGTYRDGYYYLETGNSYSGDYSYEYTRYVYYYPDDDELTFDLRMDSLTSDFSYYLYFTVDMIDGVYSYSSFDDSDYTMRGTIYANTFTDNTLVGYSYTNIPSSLRSSFRNLTSSTLGLLLACINVDLIEFGIDANLLGFYYY